MSVGAILNPFSLPVHPVVVHFPIAMLSAAWIGLIGRYAMDKPQWEGRVMFLETVGVLFLPVTVVMGFVDTRGFEFLLERQWDQPLIWHFITATAAVAVFTGHLLWRRGHAGNRKRTQGLDIVLSTAGMWLLLMTGLIAGEMVYAA